MTIELYVHSHIVNGNNLAHNIQSDNLARLKQAKRLMLHSEYEIMEDIRSEAGFHAFTLWSFLDRNYTTVPRKTHTAILRLLHIPLNKIDARTTQVISTYATVQPLRYTRNRRPSSPVIF